MNCAAVRLGAGDIAIEQIECEAPDARSVAIRPTLVAVDWMDAAAATTSGFQTKFTPGREFIGVVELAGDQATALLGQRVVASPDIVCGVCDLCRGGLSAHCRERRLLGSPGCDGCLREQFTVPAMNVCAVSASLPDDQAIFALPLARALQAAWITHLEGRPYVTVLGRGAESLLAAQAMTKLNASVRVVSACEATLHAADRLGIRHRPLNQVGRRADQDVILDVSPPGRGIETAAAMARPRGKIVLLRPLCAPEFTAPDDADLRPVIDNEIEVLGSRGARLREAVTMLERAEVNVEGLITQRFKLEHAAKAFAAAQDPSQLKVVIEF